MSVTLVEANPSYTSNIMSNTVLTGQRTLASLNYAYDTLVSHYGVTRVNARVSGINSAAKFVALEGGGTIGYDRLVLAPGLDFDLMPGMSSQNEYETLIPHAWKAGPRRAAAQQLAPCPGRTWFDHSQAYRCPPGPSSALYADWLRRSQGGSRIIVLDANAASS
jgi:NADPH-dependent 2,4-dienoyl-CoA reductase/sulfur reductase-like enzyme